MKRLLEVAIIAVCLLFTHSLFSQTYVSGGIYSNTTWFSENSPYIVTGDIVLFPDKVLTIEPGVEVKFDGYYTLEIRGTIEAIGNETDSIKFVSNILNEKDAWNRIQILNSSQNANGLFEFCQVKHSTDGIAVECCWGNEDSYISHSLFENNTLGLYNYAGWDLPIDNCLFLYNTTAVRSSDKNISNSTFMYNETGIKAERFTALNCIFQFNDVAIDWNETVGYGELDSCVITDNILGVRLRGASITNCEINNNSIGIITYHESQNFNGNPYYVPIINNSICDNSDYNIKNGNSYNKDLTSNCFCISDSAMIEEKLYDGYDNISLGLFNYSIYDITCQTVIETVIKVGNPQVIDDPFINGENFVVYPNPFDSYFRLNSKNMKRHDVSVRFFNSIGINVGYYEIFDNEELYIQTDELNSGMYFIQLLVDNKVLDQKKIIKR
ncbi:MAG: hypothetical protein DRJ05_16610 [Bacteroidetes bacterium]|nr:MAG: hypothetical protein DRJ05_16610 [Bacteroidota bacterium]